MSTIIDAQGLSCPQPVLMTLKAIQDGLDTAYDVLVDTDTSRENVTRAAESKGFKVTSVTSQGQGYCLSLVKQGK